MKPVAFNWQDDHAFRAEEQVTNPLRASQTEAVMTLAIRGRGDTHDLEIRQDGTANAILTPNGGRAGIGVGAVAFSCKDHGGGRDR